MPDITFTELTSPEEIERALAIRLAVFVDEQKVAEELELDGLDDGARHLLAAVDGEPAGTLRIRFLEDGRIAKIERVAVLPEHRRYKVGHALMHAGLNLAREAGAREVLLHAQTVVQAFYAKLGFVAHGDPFTEDGILHIAMRLPLSAAKPSSQTASA
ncbi:MAG: GNAT family N-acetyltransferase [Pseudomonadota bacterium]